MSRVPRLAAVCTTYLRILLGAQSQAQRRLVVKAVPACAYADELSLKLALCAVKLPGLLVPFSIRTVVRPVKLHVEMR
jgi:hypothetical protein